MDRGTAASWPPLYAEVGTMFWEMSANTTHVSPAGSTGVLSVDTTHVLSANTTDLLFEDAGNLLAY